MRLVVGGDHELVAGVGDVGQAEDLHGRRRPGFLDLLAGVVDEGADPAEGGAGHQRVADAERAALDEDGGHGAPADVEMRFEHAARGPALGVGAEVLDLGHQEEAVEQLVDAVAVEGGDLGEDGVAAPLLGDQVLFGELLHDAVGVGALAVHLVDGHDDGHVGRLGVVERLEGLGHHAVVGGHDQDDDVGGLGAAGPHGGERLVARGVDEGEDVPVLLGLVGADVLGDATGLAGDHVGLADVVEELGLAVVDVAHDRDDRAAGAGCRRPRRRRRRRMTEQLVDAEALLELDLLLLAGIDEADLGAELGGEQLDHVVGERLGGRDHLALLHEEADDVGRGAVQLGADVLRGGGPLDDDLALGDRRVVRREAGGLDGLQLVAVATTTTTAALRWAATADRGRDVRHRDRHRGHRRGGDRHRGAGACSGPGRPRHDGRGGCRDRWGTGGAASAGAGRGRDRLAAAARSWGRAGAGWACPSSTWAA